MSAPDSPVLLVDGHSMIFAWQDLRVLHQKNRESARCRLVEVLSRYADSSGESTVIVVFDGKGSKTSKEETPTGVQVFYSKSGQTADAVIERLVAKYSHHHVITVATDDHMERSTVAAFGGQWISSEELAMRLQSAEASLQGKIRNINERNRR